MNHVPTIASELEDGILERIPQVPRLPRSVETVTCNMETMFPQTAQMLIKTAEHLEAKALSLREKAAGLSQATSLAAEVREAVEFERQCFEEVRSLALIRVDAREG